MKTHHRLDVTLTLLGPILTRGGMMAEPGIDAPLARDGFRRPMLPFSLIKGKIRDAFRALLPASDPRVDAWLGKIGTPRVADRGQLRFSDFVTGEAGQTTDGVIERIKIDQATGSTAGHMLAMLEAPFGYGQPVAFQGAVEFIADDQEAKDIAAALDQAFRWVPAFGALRTVGFGRTHCVKIIPVACPKRSRGSVPQKTSLPVKLRLDRPLCLVGRKHSGNHFESLETIPGAVLKGAVARLILELSGLKDDRFLDPTATYPRWPSLCKHFEVIRFAEARPMAAAATHRPVEPPLSIVTSPTIKGSYFDVALGSGPMLIGGAAPAFVPDWKDEDFGFVRNRAFGWPALRRERRTRTAIEESTGRAKDEALFSYGLVLPEFKDDDGTIKSFVWETSIGLEHVNSQDQQKVINELADLLTHGLPGIGKTRAVADVEWLSAPTPTKVPEVPLAGPEHVVTLQTEFLMTDPHKLNGSLAVHLESAYRDFWNEASGGAFELVRYFARQALHGGFLSKRSRLKKYEPFLATERGSTFVLRATDSARAATALQTWRERGLPVPGWVRTRCANGADPHWRTCPFLPHAGFGEVAIDLKCHTPEPQEQQP